MIVLDGAYGEGGGQILRTALVLSLLTGEPFRVENIRQGRPNPGLKAQHLHIVRALLEMSSSRATGAAPGAREITFEPGQLRGGHYSLDVGTAGAIPLVLQTLLPVSLFTGAPVRWMFRGGTDVPGAMTMAFWQRVLLPFFSPYAYRLDLRVPRFGFYPAGGGQVVLEVAPAFDQATWPAQVKTAPALLLADRGALQSLEVRSVAGRELASRQVAERQSDAFRQVAGEARLQVAVEYEESRSPGCALTAIAHYTQTRLGADGLGARGKPAEEVGREVARRLHEEMGGAGTVDVHTADNVMLLAALFGGRYRFGHVTGHIATNAWVIEHFLPGHILLDGTWVTGR